MGKETTKIFDCVKSVRIRSYTGPFFLTLGLNTDQNKSEYRYFLRSATVAIWIEIRRDARQFENFQWCFTRLEISHSNDSISDLEKFTYLKINLD